MSRTTPHLCATPDCPTIIEGPGHCPAHRRHGGSGTSGYGNRAWRRARDTYIAAHPDCETPGCNAPGLDVDHVDGRHPSAPGANHPSNLRTLCRSCHRRKTEHAKRNRSSTALC